MKRKALAIGAVTSGLLFISTPAGAAQPQIIWGPDGVAITAPSTCPPGAYEPCSWLGYMNEPDVPKTVGLGPIPPGFTFDISYPSDFCGVLQADALYRVNTPTDFSALGGWWELSYGSRFTNTHCTPPTTTTTEPSTTTTTVAPTTTTTQPAVTTTTAPAVTTTTGSTGCLIHGSTDSGTNCPPSTYTSTPPTVAPAVSISPPKPPQPQTEVDGAPIPATAPQLPYTGVPVARLLVIGGGLIAIGLVLLTKLRTRRTP